MTNRKWKDLCDLCNEWKTDCHSYEQQILCPECAKKLGYKLWERPTHERKGKK